MAGNQDKKISEVIRELLEKVINYEENIKLQKMHTGLKELEGVGNTDIKDASLSIDETLYGKKGAWSGRNFNDEK